MNPKYRMFALLLGALLEAAVIVAMTVFRDTIQTKEAAKKKLEGECLEVIAHEKKEKAADKKAKTSILISNPLVSYTFVNRCQSMRSRITHHMDKRGQKVLLVTSASENEGKSTVTANLALALTAQKKKVMLIDGDLRRPAIYKIFDIEKFSFSDFGRALQEQDMSYEYIENQKINMVLSKRPNSSPRNLLSGETFQKYLEKYREEMDYIIIDTPPMLAASDAEVLAQFADVAIMVIHQDMIYARDLNDCIDVLNRSNAEFMGYVLNDFV